MQARGSGPARKRWPGGTSSSAQFTSKRGRNLKAADLGDEVKKARRLVKAGRCDSYILMTNAGVSGTAAEEIEALFKKAGVKYVAVFGSTWICDQIRENKRSAHDGAARLWHGRSQPDSR